MLSRCRPLPAIVAFLLACAWLGGPPAPAGAADPLPPTPTPTPSAAPFHPLRPQSIFNPIPRSGDQRVLLVLVDFPDHPGSFAQDAFARQFFGTWPTGSWAEYFREVSSGQLRYTGDVAGLRGGAPIVNSTSVAYVRLPNPRTFYANNENGFGDDFPRNNGGAVYHALQALDAAGFDFAPYADAGKQVQTLVVVFAGSSYADTQTRTSPEATAFSLSQYVSGGYGSRAGYRFDNYTFCPEKGLDGAQKAIGVCTHEHGHGLGMADLYDFSFTTSGAGYYDLMSYGTYGLGLGERPYHPGPFSKERFGWVNPRVLGSGKHTVTLAPFETSPDVIKLFPNGVAGKEYFLLENRQHRGFDADMTAAGFCPGLLIWHVDGSVVDAFFDPNKVNTLPSAGGPAHPGVVVVEADGDFALITPPMRMGTCQDTWAAGRRWDAASTPSSRLWSGQTSGLAVIVGGTAPDGSIQISIGVGEEPAPLATPTPTGTPTRTPTATPTYSPTPFGTPARSVLLPFLGRAVSGW